MSAANGVIAPADGDIYYYETMAELDAHEVEGDRARAQKAKLSSQVMGIVFGVVLLIVLLAFISSPLLAVGLVLLTCASVLSWYLYDLLELCDD